MIRRAAATGYTLRELAAEYDVSHETISQIVRGDVGVVVAMQAVTGKTKKVRPEKLDHIVEHAEF
jgi:transposase